MDSGSPRRQNDISLDGLWCRIWSLATRQILFREQENPDRQLCPLGEHGHPTRSKAQRLLSARVPLTPSCQRSTTNRKWSTSTRLRLASCETLKLDKAQRADQAR